MIYIFTALRFEAKPLVKLFNLKKNSLEKMYDVFENTENSICLTITGVGQISMAAAVAHVLTMKKTSRNDFILNIGISAGNNEGIYMINKIIEEVTGRTFYPDMIYRHEFMEEALYSGMTVKNANEAVIEGLYDMEGAAFYQSAIKYVNSEKISLIKIVSDKFEGEKVNIEKVNSLLESNVEKINTFIVKLLELGKKNNINEDDFLYKINRLSDDLRLSVTLKEQLRHLLYYLELENEDYDSIINEYYLKELIPCKSKKEGKLILDELQKRFI